MDYNRLKSFVIIADSGSITTAARTLRRTQPAVSHQLQKLEEELGFKVFERQKGKLLLSPQGTEIYRIAKSKLGEIDDDVCRIRNDIKQIEGNIRIGVLGDGGHVFSIGDAIGSFSKQYPKVSFEVIFGTNELIESGLMSNQLDLGICVFYQQPKLFHKFPIETSRYLLVSSASYLTSVGAVKRSEQAKAIANCFIIIGLLGEPLGSPCQS